MEGAALRALLMRALRAPRVLRALSQGAQYPLIKEYGLNYTRIHIVIYKLIGLSGLRTRRALRERRALRAGSPKPCGA